jgi:hypothetical protein
MDYLAWEIEKSGYYIMEMGRIGCGDGTNEMSHL